MPVLVVMYHFLETTGYISKTGKWRQAFPQLVQWRYTCTLFGLPMLQLSLAIHVFVFAQHEASETIENRCFRSGARKLEVSNSTATTPKTVQSYSKSEQNKL